MHEEFSLAEEAFRKGQPPAVPPEIERATSILMTSATQAYREALIGCALARLVDPEIDIQQPSEQLGDNAFSGRSLDERVVNPFLHENEIPASKNPYLSALRRAVELRLPVPPGQRDAKAFTALVEFLEALKQVDDPTARTYLRYLLYGFLRLREQSNIQLIQVKQLHVDQVRQLLARFLSRPSGGWIPLIVVVAVFHAIRDSFGLDWNIQWHDINVADAPANAPGDVTVSQNDNIILSVEVTERQIDQERVRSTFRSKIAERQVTDYIFLSTREPTPSAREASYAHFAQGHHMGFLDLTEWAVNILATIGPNGRAHFVRHVVGILDHHRIPRAIKVAWNQALEAVIRR